MSLAHLERLNPEQRRAVEHGIEEVGARPGRPVLVIAGAGSGKTSTLAHRVAHMVVRGTDPRRILLQLRFDDDDADLAPLLDGLMRGGRLMERKTRSDR